MHSGGFFGLVEQKKDEGTVPSLPGTYIYIYIYIYFRTLCKPCGNIVRYDPPKPRKGKHSTSQSPFSLPIRLFRNHHRQSELDFCSETSPTPPQGVSNGPLKEGKVRCTQVREDGMLGKFTLQGCNIRIVWKELNPWLEKVG